MAKTGATGPDTAEAGESKLCILSRASPALSGQERYSCRSSVRAPAARSSAPPVASLTPDSRMTREEAVAAYVSGRIPVEEFLRITRGVSA